MTLNKGEGLLEQQCLQGEPRSKRTFLPAPFRKVSKKIILNWPHWGTCPTMASCVQGGKVLKLVIFTSTSFLLKDLTIKTLKKSEIKAGKVTGHKRASF